MRLCLPAAGIVLLAFGCGFQLTNAAVRIVELGLHGNRFGLPFGNVAITAIEFILQ